MSCEGGVLTNKPSLLLIVKLNGQVKMKNNKDLYLSSFYMPHRNMKDK